MSCVKDTAKARLVQAAELTGMSLPPMINQHCPSCGTFHIIDLSDVCDQRFGRAPVDIVKSDKPIKWELKKYCQVCHAYHNSDGYCGGVRDVENWADEPMGR